MMENNKKLSELINFVNHSPTAFHAVGNLKKILLQSGFQEIQESDEWNLEKGKSYFVSRHHSSLCAFKIPLKNPSNALILGSHTDSPALKLKPNPESIIENMVMWGVEIYGAPLLSSWLNRDLGLAGSVCCLKDGILEEKLVCIDNFPVTIPQLAIHLDRTVNETGLILNKQEHLSALACLNTSKTNQGSYLESLLKDEIGNGRLISHDLFLYPIEKARYLGNNREMIAGYRLDNLCSVHAMADALISAENLDTETLALGIFWDHEEIGSSSAEGANSPFLNHLLERLLLSLKMDRESFLRLLNNSLCVSVDLGHAAHPNYLEKSDKQHKLLLNQGIAIKSNAQKRYASDARTSAVILKFCHSLNIPFQQFVSRNDIPCGSTIGPIAASLTGIPTVDIGIAQLSMHSCRELIGSQDHLHMCALLKALLEQAP